MDNDDGALPPACPVEVRFSLSKSLWFDLVFVVGTQGRVVETSDTMWHVGALLDWLRAIVRKDARPVMDVDREGWIDRLEALHVDDDRVRLRIMDLFDPSKCFVDAVVSRRKLVWEIYFELMAHRDAIAGGSDPDALSLLAVEAWLDWPRYKDRFSMTDDVTGLERACRPGWKRHWSAEWECVCSGSD